MEYQIGDKYYKNYKYLHLHALRFEFSLNVFTKFSDKTIY